MGMLEVCRGWSRVLQSGTPIPAGPVLTGGRNVAQADLGPGFLLSWCSAVSHPALANAGLVLRVPRSHLLFFLCSENQ